MNLFHSSQEVNEMWHTGLLSYKDAFANCIHNLREQRSDDKNYRVFRDASGFVFFHKPTETISFGE